MSSSYMLALLIAVASMFSSLPTYAIDTPVSLTELLAKLETAERQLSFTGRYTYEHGGTIETFEIVRLVLNGIEIEKTVHLSGPKREQVRFGRDTRCLTTSNLLLRGHYLNLNKGGALSLNQNYDFYFLGHDRVANRKVFVIRIEPKDKYRYGYRLAVDEDTGLIMRTVITSGKKNALERVQYVALEPLLGDMSTHFTPDELQQYTEKTRQQADSAKPCDLFVEDSSPWQPTWIPGGFILTDYTLTEKDGHMETYSDGLSVFSVFASTQDEAQIRRSLAHRGATVAFVTSLELHNTLVNVAVVGEIPMATAQRITASMINIELSAQE